MFFRLFLRFGTNIPIYTVYLHYTLLSPDDRNKVGLQTEKY